MRYQCNLDTVLLNLPSNTGFEVWTIRDCIEGSQIFGGIGSGKTSGSGKTIALKYLLNKFGGLVLTAKPSEKQLWINYCKQTGRNEDLIILEPGGEHSFNFLEYISKHPQAGVSLTENIVQILKTVIRSSEEKSSAKADDPFWENALDLLLFNSIDLCLLAYGKVSVTMLYEIVTTAPKKGVEINSKPKTGTFGFALERAQQKITDQIDLLVEKMTEAQKAQLEDDYQKDIFFSEHITGYSTLKTIDQFFSEFYLNVSDKTKGIIEFCFTGFLFRLLKEPVSSLLCSKESTVTPEDCLDGKIILVNLPVKNFQKVGRDAQVLVKYIWQQAMERRNIELNNRPIFLWADEAQHFIHEYDAECQATARSSMIATVYLTQNLPNYHANMGGAKSEYRVKAFLGTLASKFFHANADLDTNIFASSLIGEAYETDTQNSVSIGENFSSGKSESYRLKKMVRPEHFVQLKTGGPKNNFITEAYIHKQGNSFSDGFNHKLLPFKQTI